MTEEQFWDRDPNLAKYYRQAEEIRNERMNQELWLQGMYIYEALCDVSPILNAFAKRGTKPHKYPDKPYSISEKQRKREVEDEEKQTAQKGKMMMEMFMSQHNKKFEGTSQST